MRRATPCSSNVAGISDFPQCYTRLVDGTRDRMIHYYYVPTPKPSSGNSYEQYGTGCDQESHCLSHSARSNEIEAPYYIRTHCFTGAWAPKHKLGRLHDSLLFRVEVMMTQPELTSSVTIGKQQRWVSTLSPASQGIIML